MWQVKWSVAKTCKTILKKGTLTASFLPAAHLLCIKQVRMIYPWWTGWYPEVWYSLLVQIFLVIGQPALLNAMTTDLSRNSCVVHLWLRVAWPSYQPLSCGLRWNGFLMTGHLLVRKQRSKPSAPLPWQSTHHKHLKTTKDTQFPSATIQRMIYYCLNNDSESIAFKLWK